MFLRDPEGREPQHTFSLREAVISDKESIACIQRDSWLDTYVDQDIGVNEEDIRKHLGSLEDLIQEWNTALRSAEQIEDHTFVIDENGKIIGFCRAKKFPKENRIVSLHIDPKRRSMGAGTNVFERDLQWLEDEKDVSLGVVATNNRAITFYKKFDFGEDGDGPDIIVHGKAIPTIRMVRKNVHE